MKIARLIDHGAGVSFQDSGRPGWRRFGIPSGGAMDISSAQQANLLVNNHPDTCVLELTLQGAVFEFLQDTWLAVTGANTGSSIPAGSARMISAGEMIRFPYAKSGVWTYLAIPGGWQAPRWFGSCSTYARGNIGEPLVKGITLNSPASNSDSLQPAPASVSSRHLSPGVASEISQTPPPFPIYPGPQLNEFPPPTRNDLVTKRWEISPHSDRTGYRMEGEPLALAPEITSEAVLPGSFQVPANGQPIITMPDGPTVGGYPKIAWMEPAALWRLAQCRPGTHVYFQWIQ
jgi:antagonist of KipI